MNKALSHQSYTVLKQSSMSESIRTLLLSQLPLICDSTLRSRIIFFHFLILILTRNTKGR